MDLNQKLLNAFQIEHLEHLEGIRSALVRVEKASGHAGGSSDSAREALEEAFRCAHSLKGAARIIGLAAVETLAHHLESFFSRLRASPSALEKEPQSVVQLTLDSIEDATAAFLRGEPVAPPQQILQELNRLLAAEPAPVNSQPMLQPMPPKPVQETPAAAEEAKPQAAARPAESVRLSAESLDRLLQSSGQLLTAGLQQETLVRELRELAKEIAALDKRWQNVKRRTLNSRSDPTAEIATAEIATAGIAAARIGPAHDGASTASADQFDNHVELVDRQFHSITRRARGIIQIQQRNSALNRQLADQLRDDVRRARIVPAESIFQGFRKMMRDLAHDERKDIDFRVSGLETEADRAVLQALKDPLMHVLRNAVCHGIEPPQRRSAAGKSSQGRVSLSLEAVGNQLIVTVEDDGRGIDLRQVSQQAARQGLISSSDAAGLSDEKLLDILVRPGFSTCERVTALAGRGLGLAIVHETIARLQGRISVRPREGGGTIVSLAVPTTVSSHRIMLASCGGQTFGIPLSAIETVLRVDASKVETIEGRAMLSSNGELISLVSLAALIELNGSELSPTERLTLIVLKSAARRLAIAVDGLLAERDAIIQEIGPPASKSIYFSGGILREDGSVALVLDPAAIVKRSAEPDVASRACRPAVAAKQSPAILVVDDSVTTRTLETTILQSHGYQVLVAVDGAEALDRLRAEHVDLVISDIQMPRLDGFGLLEEIKSDARLSATPVIIVSSMESREYQERGLRLGADAYVVKRNFDHQELLQVIEQLV